ncbi:MAG: DNA primase [Deltaproteobacteria bacterium]|nr:DNA primase [Deltaproteobacteria bacterium]MBI3075475.1 DNA primase [Deltaproteobacteria bacterium]
MRVADELIAEIRQRTSIVQVIADYVALRKAGRNYVGLCPFHAERTPSFTVNEEKEIFHCFGCGAGGNVFHFLMRHENLTFQEALKLLADRLGVALRTSPGEARRASEAEALYELNQKAAAYYHRLLLESPEGERGRAYLAERGVTEATIREYELGYAPERWDGLAGYLAGQGVSPEAAERLGLIVLRDGRGVDRFRRRVIFPIRNLTGRVVGFGGRTLGEELPKYLNSPDSAIYHKGKLLYGLHVAKGPIRSADLAIIVEGYFDLLMLHQLGLRNAVATLGTALTPDHVRLLQRFTRTIVTFFDGDEAGTKATARSLELFLEEGVQARVALLPRGMDPDSFGRAAGAEGLRRQVAQALPVADFFIRQALQAHDSRTPQGKAGVVEAVGPILRKIRSEVERSVYVRRLAELLELDEPVILRALRALPAEGGAPPVPPSGRSAAAEAGGLLTLEEMILKLLLEKPGLQGLADGQELAEAFTVEGARGLYLWLRDAGERPDLSRAALELEEGPALALLHKLAVAELELPQGQARKMLTDCVRRLKRDRIRQQRMALRREIGEASEQGDTARLRELQTELNRLTELERELVRGSAA